MPFQIGLLADLAKAKPPASLPDSSKTAHSLFLPHSQDPWENNPLGRQNERVSPQAASPAGPTIPKTPPPALEGVPPILEGSSRLAIAGEIGATRNSLGKSGGVSTELLPADGARQTADQKKRLQQKMERASAPLRPLIQQAWSWLERAEQICQRWQESSLELGRIQSEREALQRQFQRSQQRVEAVGQTHSMGLLLRKQLSALPDPGEVHRQIRVRQREIQSITLELFDSQDRQTELSKPPHELPRYAQALASPPEGLSPQTWQQRILEWVQEERQQLNWLVNILHRYFETLVELDEAQTALLHLVEEYKNYINEHIFWIRSTPLLGSETFRHIVGAFQWLAQPNYLPAFLDASWEGFQNRPGVVIVGLGLLVLWGYGARRFRQSILRIGQQAQQEDFARFLPTVQVVGMTLVAAGFRPAILWLVPRCLGWSLSPVEGVRAVSETFQFTAQGLFPWELLLAICTSYGLGESHFGWPPQTLRALRRWLRVAGIAMVPWVLLVAVFHYQSEERFDSSLGRVAFLVLMVVWMAALIWLFRAKSEFVQGLSRQPRRPSWIRFRLGAYWLGIVIPLSLAVLAAWGYYYTAQQLAIHTYVSLVVIGGFVWLGAMTRRGVLVLLRRLGTGEVTSAVSPSWKSDDSKEPTEPPQPSEAPPSPSEKTPASCTQLAQLADQVDRLLSVLLLLAAIATLGMVWRDILPALAILKRIPLWRLSWEAAASAVNGGKTPIPGVPGEWVTAADLLWAVVVLLITYLATKNLPALLELLLPQQLSFDQGARFALRTLLQYALVLLGLLLALPPLGVTWTRMQWLVAALGVGLGFGLQEIFANFISGLILLFERPIRVGDIVTIGDVTGVVSKIHIRATIITNWDRQDLIVPNKEFITSRVLNWTLTNLTNRIVLQVGVAYGTDPDRVRRILQEILQEHPLILRDPAPLVCLEKFGESGMEFVIRAYLPTLDQRLQTIHEVYTAIHNRFRQEGIAIPFPHREVVIRSWPPEAAGSS